jgi:hypothetical protein
MPEFHEMSDEEFLAASPPSTEEVDDADDDSDSDDGGVFVNTDDDADDDADDAEDDKADNTDDGDSDDADVAAIKEDTDAGPDAGDTTKPEGQPDEKPAKINYEAEYKKLLEPFAANGKQIQVDNITDAKRLMSMGANYFKKMAALKPALKVVKLLENNGLMDETKLNFLIDLNSKNPAAITQLLKDAQIDPLQVDMDSDSTYTPQARTITDNEMQLDEVLGEIKGTPTYNRTLDVITKEWDETSQSRIVAEPSLIATINEHVATGDFDQVTSLVERERALGKLTGVSDLDAYYRFGMELSKKGHLKSQQPADPTKSSLPSLEKPVRDKDEVRKRKQAASSSRAKTTVSKNTEYKNLLSMSDEEFLKLSSPPYKQL